MAEKAKITTTKRSIIKQYFTNDMYIDIIRIIKIHNIDNNKKGMALCQMLRDKYNLEFSILGSGTNRIAIKIDGYAVKIALDEDGCIDNRREMLYTKKLQPYVIKVYECVPSGLLAVSEYVTFFSIDEFHRYKQEMANILTIISENYLIGDCGITGKNYGNWGVRTDGTICILDFAYIYDVKFNVFSCSCNESTYLKYDANFVNLICPACERKYTFGELRRRITKAQQEEEIGDIRRLSYNMTEAVQEFEKIPEFEPQEGRRKKKDKKLSENELLIKKIKEDRELSEDPDSYWGL